MGAECCRLQPNDVAAGSPIEPEVKVEALDTLGNVLTEFDGTVRVAIGSDRSGGTLSGTVRVAALSGVAFFDTLVINRAGSGYTLVASAPGMVSVTSAPFTVFGAIGDAAVPCVPSVDDGDAMDGWEPRVLLPHFLEQGLAGCHVTVLRRSGR